jgi:hypothetical protein
MHDYKTCTHTYDSGRACKSAAAKGREFCGYHLHYRGRLLRRAQSRARHQRYDITLPPLDSLCSIQSALSEVAEALAADMIDPRRAMGLLKALRFAKENLKDGLKDDSAHWHDTPYLTQDAAAYDNFEAEYGLPKDIDVTTPPEVAFPSTDTNTQDGCPVQAQLERGFSADKKVGWPIPPSSGGVGLSSDLSPMPTVDYCEHGPGCPEHTIRADYPETADLAELREIQHTQGTEARVMRYKEQQRNQRRRHLVSSRKHYAAIALETNLRLAAERLAERKLAERAAPQEQETDSEVAKKQPATAACDNIAGKTEEAIA